MATFGVENNPQESSTWGKTENKNVITYKKPSKTEIRREENPLPEGYCS